MDAWRQRRYRLILSEHILAELERTLALPYFRRYIPPEEAQAGLALLRQRAVITPITVTVQGVATRPEDDLVLATAVSGGADYLVTGDSRLQRLGSHQQVTILSPRQFLDVLQDDEGANEQQTDGD